MKEDLEKLKKEREEYLNGWKRAKADLINYQKDENQRLNEAIIFANSRLAKDILNVLDSFQLAASAATRISADQGGEAADLNAEKTRKGFLLIQSQLQDILKRHGVEKIIVKKGDNLDVSLHEVMREVELDASDSALAGKIAEEILPGYKMHDRVLRASKVSIGKILSTKS